MRQILVLFFCATFLDLQGQTIDPAFQQYSFQAGEKTLFEDYFNYPPGAKISSKWEFLDGGGAASIGSEDSVSCLSIDEYYTRLKPILFNTKILPDSFAIEYDCWLDAGYDGNPGITILLRAEDDRSVSIVPNKHEMNVTLPDHQSVSKDNPEAYFGENKFYSRWVHISISVYKTQMTVYLDQYKMLEIPDIQLKPAFAAVYGDASGGMKMLMKNFRISTGFPNKLEFTNGIFVTRAIRFDVNKSVLKPESISILRQVKTYLVEHPDAKISIQGHTDSDGSMSFNLALSQQRAEAVMKQLVSMGIAESRLIATGLGEGKPLDTRLTPEAKAMNRRVVFSLMK